jgi:hypothetical protein
MRPSRIRSELTRILAALDVDATYSVEDSGLASRWEVNPDPRPEVLSPHDLQATIGISGAQIEGRMNRHTVAITVTAANYSGTRTMRGSLEPLTAEDRIHGAMTHLTAARTLAPLPLLPLGYSDPEQTRLIPPADGSMWLISTASYSLSIPR